MTEIPYCKVVCLNLCMCTNCSPTVSEASQNVSVDQDAVEGGRPLLFQLDMCDILIDPCLTLCTVSPNYGVCPL